MSKMRLFITLPHCPGCRDIHKAVEQFNTGKSPFEQIKIHYYYSPPTEKIMYLIDKIYNEKDLEAGLGPPLIIFDGVTLRRRDFWDGLGSLIEIKEMLETLHSKSERSW